MALSHKTVLSSFDEDTQVLLSAVYVDLCATLPENLDDQTEVREKIANVLIRQALLGERDRDVLKREAIAASAKG